MKHVLIICAAGMSSSLMAKKTTKYLQEDGKEIEIDATSVNEGKKMISEGKYDLFLVSPQTKMYYDDLKKSGDRANKTVVSIPAQAYVPIQMGIEKLGKLISDELPNE